MHRHQRNADVNRQHAEPRRRQRPNRRATRHRIVRHELLGRHPGRRTSTLPQRPADTISGVPLVGIDLEQRTLVEQRMVGRIELLDVIGMAPDRVDEPTSS